MSGPDCCLEGAQAPLAETGGGGGVRVAGFGGSASSDQSPWQARLRERPHYAALRKVRPAGGDTLAAIIGRQPHPALLTARATAPAGPQAGCREAGVR
jgi:hypothetical protein